MTDDLTIGFQACSPHACLFFDNGQFGFRTELCKVENMVIEAAGDRAKRSLPDGGFDPEELQRLSERTECYRCRLVCREILQRAEV